MATTERTVTAPTRPTAGAVVAVIYALAAYAGFTLVFVYAIAFLADVVVPRGVDHGGLHASTMSAVLIDSCLLAVFAVQHSVMARPGFKARWTHVVPRHVERATYVLASSAALALAFWQWRPIPSVVWDVDWPPARVALWSLFVAGWLWALAMTFAIDHFALFGLSQVARHLRGMAAQPSSFAVPLPYRLCRHPMMLGFFVGLVATPTMTVGHLLFAVLGTAYIVVGVRLEERDLASSLPEYAEYAATTPRLVPGTRARVR
jgi:protein-S-isoprenylcysteine O-methyltransferase Ste14